jgi:hypothetical protein
LEAQFRTRDGRLFIKFEAANMKDLFEQLAKNQEVFDADTACGCCGKTNLRFRVRNVTDKKNPARKYNYYELTCMDCWARLSFGQSNDTVSLFPKRTDEQGNWLANRGWYKYQPSGDSEDQR